MNARPTLRRITGTRRSIAAGVVAVEVIVVLLAVPATARVGAALAAVALLGSPR